VGPLFKLSVLMSEGLSFFGSVVVPLSIYIYINNKQQVASHASLDAWL